MDMSTDPPYCEPSTASQIQLQLIHQFISRASMAVTGDDYGA
jgi:hypothetical protein